MYLTYQLAVQTALVLLLAAFVRHTLYRARFFVHAFQLNGYKRHEYAHWMREHRDRHVFSGVYAWYCLLLLAMLWFGRTYLTGSANTWVLALFAWIWFGVGEYRRPEKKPLAYTARVKRLLVPIILADALLIGWGLYGSKLWEPNAAFDPYILAFVGVMVSLLQPGLVWVAGWWMEPVEKRIQQGFIDRAKAKLAAMPDLKIVAMTGSYGKTSVKFMVKTLLSERYAVCSTPGSYNTPMGITKVINEELDASHRILILEMGARYAGNIDELCDIARPDVAIVTNVGIAHLETFGSQDVIAREKGTLVRRLAPGGAAVLNADDARVAAMAAGRPDVEVIPVGLSAGRLRAEAIRYDARGCAFTVVLDGTERAEVRMRLLGRHNVLNLLLAMGVGLRFGLRLPTMALAAARIEPVEHRLELKQAGGFTVIDDAFNSNPVGAANAVEVLAAFEGGRRCIVTPGMVELGPAEEAENFAFGEAIGRSGIESAILVGPRRTRPILEGILSTGFPEDRILTVKSLAEAQAHLSGWLQAGDVVLYENDLPDTYSEA